MRNLTVAPTHKNSAVCLLVLLLLLASHVYAQDDAIRLDTETERAATVQTLTQTALMQKQEALNMAKSLNWPVRAETLDGVTYELIKVVNGTPYYYVTHNVNAAISTAANLLRNTAPYNLSGTGLAAGIWDGGAVRSTHQEFGARVIVRDSGALSDHATHVGGTIGAVGTDAAALGMAPAVGIDSYEWTNDVAEMTSRAATGPNQSDKLYISNHSYGWLTGWTWIFSEGTWKQYWYGTWNEREDRGFGQYDAGARLWDDLCYNAPYYLPCKSAGNDRNNSAPFEGETFYYYQSGWKTKSYDPATDPYDDFFKGGYNTIERESVAKNVLTVGAVNDAVSGSTRNIGAAGMADFSSWGPADDGRLKPDVVANGVDLYSSISTGDATYETYSGTSMAAPNATGSAILLIEYYRSRFAGQDMRSSMLKGLIIHTADDIGNPGPDYANGWGLMNTKAAADHIMSHADGTTAMIDDTVSSGQPTRSYPFTWDGVSPIRVTLCWTDPPGPAQTGLNISTPVLVNDLDLRIIAPDGTTVFFPYILNRTNPALNATTGDNTLDNVEQVYISQPQAAGDYTIEVTYKGTLVGTQQDFALLLSGQTAVAGTVATPTFSPAPGTYASAQNVTLSCATAGATIHYTINGTEPTEASAQYTNAIAISTDTTIKAKAWKTDWTPSAVATGDYIFCEGIEGFETGNFSQFPWNSAGNAPWTVTTGDKHSGTYSARAGTITHSQSTTMEVTMQCVEGMVSFWRKVSSESNFDFLRFYIDGAQVASWSGTLSWSQFEYPVSAGTHTFRWTYIKGLSVTSGSDTAWVDDIVFPVFPVSSATRVIGLSGNMAFGSVQVGNTLQRTLTISNSGNSALTVSSISYPSGFSGAWNGQIAAGNSQNVTVTFAPQAAQSYSGTITVDSDKTSGTHTMAASGTGTVPLTATIYNAWWQGEVDDDGDGYHSAMQLCFDPDVSGGSGSLNVFVKIYYRQTGTGQWNLGLTSETYSITGTTTSDARYMTVNPPDTKSMWDYKIEIYRQGQGAYDYVRDPSNDSDLSAHKEEPAGQDVPSSGGCKKRNVTIAEEVLPLDIESNRDNVLSPSSPLAVRMAGPIDPASVWAEAEFEGAVCPGTATWIAVDETDGWIVFTPDHPLPEGMVAVTFGVERLDGTLVEPIVKMFQIGNADEPIDGEVCLEDVVDVGSSLRKEVALPGASTYEIGPSGVFAEPAVVQIPVPAGADPNNIEIYYYSESAAHTGWFKANQVEGWIVPGSRQTVTEDNQTYIEIEVNHSGIVQLGRAEHFSQAGLKNATSDLLLLGLVLGLLYKLRTRWQRI